MTERRRGSARTVTALVAVLWLTAALRAKALAAQTADPIAEARSLSAAGHYAAAARALNVYLAAHPDDNGTRWFHAQLLSWAGRRNEARREYENVLRRTAPIDPATDSLKRYIADLSNGWVGVGVTAAGDDQRLRSRNGAIEAGRYVSDNVAFHIDGAITRFSGDDDKTLADEALAATRNLLSAGIQLTDVHGSLAASIGVDHSTATAYTTRIRDTTFATWSVRGAASVLPKDIAITASLDRAGYYWTLGSLVTPVVVRAREIGLERQNASGVTGRAAVRRESYIGNATDIAYAWIMAPPLRVTSRTAVRAGYSYDFRDASASTWNGAHYNPYYTPENAHVHSIIASLSSHALRHTAQVNGSIGVHASESAPFLMNPSGKQVGFTSREYTPWALHATYVWRVTWHTSINAQVHHSSTAFYNQTSAQLGTSLLFR